MTHLVTLKLEIGLTSKKKKKLEKLRGFGNKIVRKVDLKNLKKKRKEKKR